MRDENGLLLETENNQVDADLDNIAHIIATDFAGGNYEINQILRTLNVYEGDFETIEGMKMIKDGRFGTNLVDQDKIQ